jgi:pimeloyl-ACP methyl ester carboxylesterase
MKALPLVCYHGSPGLPDEFSLLRRALPEMEVIAQARLGYPNYKRSDLTSPALALGYSWGCVDALLECAESERVRGVILVSPYLFPKSRLGPLSEAAIRLPWIGNALLRQAKERIHSQMFEESRSSHGIPSAYWEMAERMTSPPILRRAILEKQIETKAIFESLEKLRGRGLRVGVICGKRDGTQGEQSAQIRKRLDLSFEHEVEDGGHALIWTHPEEVARAVRRFQSLAWPI